MSPQTSCARVWATLHEPRAITALAVALYIVLAVTGCVVLALTLARPATDLRDATLSILGGVLVITGAAGAPLAWTGRHYLEGGVVLGLPLAGLLIVADAAMVLVDDGDVSRPRIVTLAAMEGSATRSGGYPGSPPLTPAWRPLSGLSSSRSPVSAPRPRACPPTISATPPWTPPADDDPRP